MAEATNPKQIQIKFELYGEKKDREIGKIDEFCIRAEDVSLQDILLTFLSDYWEVFNLSNIECHSGKYKGKSIDLRLRLTEIPYIQESTKKKKVPSIIVFRQEFSTPPVSPNLETQKVERTLSTVLRTMIKGMSDPERLPTQDDIVFQPLVESEEINNFENLPVNTETGSISSSQTIPKRNLRSRSQKQISVETTNVNQFSSQFISHPSTITSHRPRSGATEYRSMKIMKKPKSNTLMHASTSIDLMSPTHKKEHRGSGFFSSANSSVDVPDDLNISGPIIEKKEFDWDKRKKENVRTTRRKKNPKYSPKKEIIMPAGTFSETDTLQLTIQPEESPSFQITCKEFETIGILRDKVLSRLRRSSCILSASSVFKLDELMLTYKIDSIEHELYNDCQFIYKTAMFMVWKKNKEIDDSVTMVIYANTRENNWELPTLYRFSRLMGVLLDEDVSQLEGVDVTGFHKIAHNDKTAVKWARRTLHSYVDEIVHKRDPVSYSLSMELESGVTPMLLALQIPIDNKVEITFHYTTVFSLTRKVNINQYASTVLKEVFPCVLACGLVEDRIELYTLQFSGELSYHNGDHELIAFKDIRRCILKNEPIHLSVTKKPSVAEDETKSLNWPPIDQFSGHPPLHTDISRERQEKFTEEIFAASMWDQTNEFSFQLVKVENLPIAITKDAKKLQVVIEMTLYHADKILVETKRTKPMPLSSFGTIEWFDVVMFDIKINNLPKAAKIMIVLKDVGRKESVTGSSKKKSDSNIILYWGLVPLFDHRGILQSGIYTLNLWRGPMPNAKIEHTNGPSFEINPCAPCINNSDSQSVKVTIQFSRNTYPVFFPSSEPETCSFMLSKEQGSSIRKQFDNLLRCLSDGKLPMSSFPSYIDAVNWGDRFQVIEVYMTLQRVSESEQGLPVATAMKLLDCKFADEKVRRFAVQVLETLPDEELEDFLLQLTQALKFEPSHDSALSRLLLKRALTNKRIGHFFFWYLRCELYNPLYVPRFAALLEAYLQGCGESMLKRFESQVEIQMKLEEIGGQVEKKGGNDNSKMQSLLQEYLQQNEIDKQELTPVYNPRIRLGQLQPAKCKIMASKKKPQWLEMKNVDVTALRMTPTKLILKIGDDLRQDVIVLRMLSLFERLWERDGLPDLHLIPYGCMATGPNTGFIEVVKNARTIADVSGVNDSKRLYEWIRSHQKNEFGEEDPEMIKEAVKRFTYSLAGYTVATFVLGIGDRHNDNVMVNSSGNLFHIDFGHFLGNIKYFLGIKREWAPFILTPDFVYVMGGEMRSTGIPELAGVEDANYISDALMVNKPDHEAEQYFRKLIKKCIDLQWTVQIMWYMHLKKQRLGGSSS